MASFASHFEDFSITVFFDLLLVYQTKEDKSERFGEKLI